MSIRTTRKEIISNYSEIISVPYCRAQFLMRGLAPVAYTAGVYGWNADIYEIAPGVAIVTGYRPYGNHHPDAATVALYDNQAKQTDDTEKIAQIRADFINNIIKK